MKQIFLVILSALILFACDSEADKKEATQFFLRGNQKFKEKFFLVIEVLAKNPKIIQVKKLSRIQ